MEDEITKKELKQESIERMKLLKLKNEIIEDFTKEDIIYVSNIGGDLQRADEEDINFIKQYEETRNVKIYHVIKQKTESKEISIFLFVDTNCRCWRDEKRDIKLGYSCAIIYTKSKEIKEIGHTFEDGKINRIVV